MRATLAAALIVAFFAAIWLAGNAIETWRPFWLGFATGCAHATYCLAQEALGVGGKGARR
jgi:hypothetical protein